MRPVSSKFATSQPFGSMPTAGVAPSNVPGTVGWYVKLYGNYQPFGHAGEDMACPVGTPVYAISSGTVLYAGWGTNLPGDDSDRGYRQRYYLYKGFPGIVTVIQHPWGKGVYAHLSDNDQAPAGARVAEGQLIGYSGDTGGVAPHLHVEALVNDSYVTGGGLIYGRTDPSKFYGSAAVGPLGTTITPLEEDDMSAEDIQYLKDKAARSVQLLLSMQDAITDPVSGYIGKAAKLILSNGNQTLYVKGKDDATIYAHDIDSGSLRGLTKEEWKVITEAGGKHVDMDQKVINDMLELQKEGA